MSYIGNTKIGAMYLGTTSIGKAYLGNDLVFQKGGVQPVMIPYIRNANLTEYIDTGITPDNTTRVIVWARNFNPHALFLFGSRVAYQNAAFGMMAGDGAATGSIRNNYGDNTSDSTNKFTLLSGYHKYELDAGVMKVDDVTLNTLSTFSGNTNNIHLFGCNNNGARLEPMSSMDICAAKIYKGGALVRDFTAVNSPTVGLYDAVSETLFTNAGSGSFTYGTFNQNAYTPLEYIACDENQYFDSGVYGTYSGSIVTKFMPTNTTAQWTSLLGFRTSSNSCDISLGTATSGQDNMRCYWRFGANNTSGQAFTGSTSNKLTNKAVVAVKSNATLTLYYNNSQIGTNAKSGVSSSFQTTYPLTVGSLRTGESSFGGIFIGRLYYVGFGADRNFVPAKKSGKAGMYDTYNDVFYPSQSGTDFIEGPTI